MLLPEVGKEYKYYKGGTYKVVKIDVETITTTKANSTYRIGIDMWNTPAITSNGCDSQRFTENKRGRKKGK